MSKDKPLHVRVAEALGWINCQLTGSLLHYTDGFILDERKWTGVNPWVADRKTRDLVFRYDTDWAATGPLIERFKITLEAPTGLSEEWSAFFDYFRLDNEPVDYEKEEIGSTPLIAVCNLILALAKAGKLEAA